MVYSMFGQKSLQLDDHEKEYIDYNPDLIQIPYIYHWWDRFWSISVVCDPIGRLLSDFKHVTRQR